MSLGTILAQGTASSVVMVSTMLSMMTMSVVVSPVVSFMFFVVGSFLGLRVRMDNYLSFLQRDSGQAFQELATLLAFVIMTVAIVDFLQEVVVFVNKLLRNVVKELALEDLQVESLAIFQSSQFKFRIHILTNGYFKVLRVHLDRQTIGLWVPLNGLVGIKESPLATWQEICRQANREFELIFLHLGQGIGPQKVRSGNKAIDLSCRENKVIDWDLIILNGIPKGFGRLLQGFQLALGNLLHGKGIGFRDSESLNLS
mmetsp:Transcript_33442/g.80957  ORF Transcript_33442/g.80957 Transcript_33442/m.80957 type:complete len:257 (+) Transcript_33442:160-930(+)